MPNLSDRLTDTMNLIKQKGALGIRDLSVLCVVLSLLGSEAVPRTNEGDDLVAKLASLSSRLKHVTNRYQQLCKQYSELPSECGAPVINCTQCPEGWIHIGDECFSLHTDKLNWSQSIEKCKEQDSDLAKLTTKEQHDVLGTEIQYLGSFYSFYWIGLNDRATEGIWKWQDNTTLDYQSWNHNPLEPDNNQDGGEEGEDCAVLNGFNGRWFDVPCAFKYPRICHKPATPLE